MINSSLLSISCYIIWRNQLSVHQSTKELICLDPFWKGKRQEFVVVLDLHFVPAFNLSDIYIISFVLHSETMAYISYSSYYSSTNWWRRTPAVWLILLQEYFVTSELLRSYIFLLIFYCHLLLILSVFRLKMKGVS